MSATSEKQGSANGKSDRLQAQEAIAKMLLDRIRADTYPSTTYMNMVEQMIPQSLRSEYFDVLLEKVAGDKFPSIPMLMRLSRLAETM